MADLVDNGGDLGVDGGLRRVVPPCNALGRDEKGRHGGAGRADAARRPELLRAALGCVAAGHRHCEVWGRRAEKKTKVEKLKESICGGDAIAMGGRLLVAWVGAL